MQTSLSISLVIILLAPLGAQDEGQQSPELQDPFKVLCGSKPINVDFGHAAPFLVDMDGDGLQDLLVGQFGKPDTVEKEGNAGLRIYKNVGKVGQPKFEHFRYFQAGGTAGTVPVG